eukprot:TRINITY_DN28785_c0_g1_i9.p2 TRINITY_DN28785_c0_g1~~TRINITY_DN28785_c0_g1_i9.p2  ORF type:complete len:215 (-),score=-17.41 TRINITY_DN28785_c0_g1_i9:13-657(-)
MECYKMLQKSILVTFKQKYLQIQPEKTGILYIQNYQIIVFSTVNLHQVFLNILFVKFFLNILFHIFCVYYIQKLECEYKYLKFDILNFVPGQYDEKNQYKYLKLINKYLTTIYFMSDKFYKTQYLLLQYINISTFIVTNYIYYLKKQQQYFCDIVGYLFCIVIQHQHLILFKKNNKNKNLGNNDIYSILLRKKLQVLSIVTRCKIQNAKCTMQN